jgi:hypothetical protein
MLLGCEKDGMTDRATRPAFVVTTGRKIADGDDCLRSRALPEPLSSQPRITMNKNMEPVGES